MNIEEWEEACNGIEKRLAELENGFAVKRLRTIKFKADCLASNARRDLGAEVQDLKCLLREVDKRGLLSESDYALPMIDFLDKAEIALYHYGIESGEF